MTIHFSIHYDGEIFVNSHTDLMGITYVGPKGLLKQLELRAGLHTEVKSDVEREAEYLYAMTPCVCGTMFKKLSTLTRLVLQESYLDGVTILLWQVGMVNVTT